MGGLPNSVDDSHEQTMTDQKHKSQVDLYLPRLVLGWDETNESKRYRETEGTLVHVDIRVSPRCRNDSPAKGLSDPRRSPPS